MALTAILLKADGTQQPMTPKNGKHFKLAELQAAVGGSIDILSPPNGTVFVVHDEGKFLFPRNVEASNQWYAAYAGHDVDFAGDFLAGDVLVAPSKMVR